MRVLILGGLGYIGSALSNYLSYKGHTICICDAGWFSTKEGAMDYAKLHKDFIRSYEVIILLAGLSSVQMCAAAGPRETFKANVDNFTDLVEKMGREQLLIYASSGSVYGFTSRDFKMTESACLVRPLSVYDMSKQIIDDYAAVCGKKVIGLRFGTVCGYSPNPRVDLMVPSMMLAARTTGVIQVSNPEAKRGVLSMQDLCRGIAAILKQQEPALGVYNMASVNASVLDFAMAVRKYTGAKVDTVQGDTKYSFQLDTSLFEWVFDFEFDHRVSAIIEDVNRIDWGRVEFSPESFKRLRVPV